MLFQVIESEGYKVGVESTCSTLEAANNRVRMLKRRNPGVDYWVHQELPHPRVIVMNHEKVSVTKI